ncbi:NAD(P)/FAD-dependent oxidoreductase [Halolamina litorea]|uniref:NAD(P)/FAD-dependent oxidoreductase n=1 Tax=Halolamina litorea TaxID=1515593 RepID=A0ABD6BQ69_9EURY|nr:NAD(P)/FAD-dependent oxidoreductase [Halolamina litorea]
MATDTGEDEYDYDVAVVGGGPAGSAVGVFSARYGLGTLIFDRGRSSIGQCAHLENYLGFPGGVDAETFYELMHDHAEEVGATIESDLVESVEPADAGEGFVVRPQTGDPVTARRVVAATRYGGEYLRGLDDGTMYQTHEYDGETHEEFDKEYANADGTTPIEGLYIASPYAETSPQALMAAGHGARVGVSVVEAVRRERGYPDSIADYYDWVRREAERTEEWSDRDRWRDLFDSQFPDDHDLPDQRVDELREREVDRRLDAYIPREDADQRAEAGQRRLLSHIDDDLILDAAAEIDAERAARTDD